MHGGDQAAAGPYDAADPYDTEPEAMDEWEDTPPSSPANSLYTPISAADRLRQPTPRSHARSSAALPPMRPGQRYGYGFSPSAEVPVEAPSQTEWAAPPVSHSREEDGAQELGHYQQAYWAQVQSGAEQAESVEEHPYPANYVPSYLRGVEQPVPYQPSPSFQDWEEEMGEGWQDSSPLSEWTREEWEPLEEDLPPEPYPGLEPMSRQQPQTETVGQKIKGKLAEAFAKNPNPETTRPRLLRIMATGLVTVMLVFCVVQVGQIVVGLLQNEEEMKALRDEYYAIAGVELAHDATRVDLPPPGQTYVPTATPVVVATPTPSPMIPMGQSVKEAAAVQQPEETPPAEVSTGENQRTKAIEYADNPHNQVMEAFVELCKENPDILGHLILPGLVDEIVVQRNNTFYLTHKANGSFSASGAVFVDEACQIKRPPENLLLRGQSLVEGNMFQPLWAYRDQGVAFVQQQAFWQLDTLYEEGQYVLVAVIVASSDASSPSYFDYAGHPSFSSDAEMESYVVAARQRSLYEIPVDMRHSDRLLTLATLSNGKNDEVLVLLARKIRPGETENSLRKALQSIRAR